MGIGAYSDAHNSANSILAPSIGARPDVPERDPLREQWMRERARREFVTASLRSHLAEQPNARHPSLRPPLMTLLRAHSWQHLRKTT